MTTSRPPQLAMWLVKHFGCAADNDAVLGDLAERYAQAKRRCGIAQQTSQIRVSLVPGGTISGRVTDAAGKPLLNSPVLVLQTIYEAGMPALQPRNSRPTDDRGEYRISLLPPGEYYLAAAPIPSGPNTSENLVDKMGRTPVLRTADIVSVMALTSRTNLAAAVCHPCGLCDGFPGCHNLATDPRNPWRYKLQSSPFPISNRRGICPVIAARERAAAQPCRTDQRLSTFQIWPSGSVLCGPSPASMTAQPRSIRTPSCHGNDEN